jgi:hypothetical protein
MNGIEFQSGPESTDRQRLVFRPRGPLAVVIAFALVWIGACSSRGTDSPTAPRDVRVAGNPDSSPHPVASDVTRPIRLVTAGAGIRTIVVESAR